MRLCELIIIIISLMPMPRTMPPRAMRRDAVLYDAYASAYRLFYAHVYEHAIC